MTRILTLPELKDRLAKDGMTVIASTPEQFRQLLVTELGRWRKLVQEREINMKE